MGLDGIAERFPNQRDLFIEGGKLHPGVLPVRPVESVRRGEVGHDPFDTQALPGPDRLDRRLRRVANQPEAPHPGVDFYVDREGRPSLFGRPRKIGDLPPVEQGDG